MEKIFWKESVDSTLTWAKEEAKKSVGKELDGALFVANEQTAGKGRLGRVWTSVPGENIYMTLLLMQPEVRAENASSLTLVMGLSVAEAVEEMAGIDAGIKWPNDIVLSDTGELLVEDLQGKVRKVFSGEVSVRGLYSYV